MVVVALLSVNLVESVDLVFVGLVVNCTGPQRIQSLQMQFEERISIACSMPNICLNEGSFDPNIVSLTLDNEPKLEESKNFPYHHKIMHGFLKPPQHPYFMKPRKLPFSNTMA